jgi:hypothetical protein
VRQVPLNAWFRFRRAVEDTPTILLLLEQEPNAKTCASLVLRLESREAKWAEASSPVAQALMPVPPLTAPRIVRPLPGYPFAKLLQGFPVCANVARSRIQIPHDNVVEFRGTAISGCAPAHHANRGIFKTETVWRSR